MALGQTELGERVKRAREDAGLTQPELAQRIGVKHPQSVSRYERGVNEIPPARLRRIAEVTGKPMTFFVQEDGNGQEERPTDDDRLERLELALMARLEAQDAAIRERFEALQAELGKLRASEPRETEPQPAPPVTKLRQERSDSPPRTGRKRAS